MDSQVLPANDNEREERAEWMPRRARHDGLSYRVTVSEAHMGFGKADRPPRTFARRRGADAPRPAIEGSNKNNVETFYRIGKSLTISANGLSLNQ